MPKRSRRDPPLNRRVPGFVDRHFSLRGSLAIHRVALGPDLLRVPADLLLMGPHAAVKAAELLARKLGHPRIARKIEGGTFCCAQMSRAGSNDWL